MPRCYGIVEARDLCDKHYRRLLKHGDPKVVARRSPYPRKRKAVAPPRVVRSVKLPRDVAVKADYVAATNGQTVNRWLRDLVENAVTAAGLPPDTRTPEDPS